MSSILQTRKLKHSLNDAVHRGGRTRTPHQLSCLSIHFFNIRLSILVSLISVPSYIKEQCALRLLLPLLPLQLPLLEVTTTSDYMTLFVFNIKKEGGGRHLPSWPSWSISQMKLDSPSVTSFEQKSSSHEIYNMPRLKHKILGDLF